ncbi:MAG: cysteinyl-tRNA synthetase [Chloroflexota bacterium]|nr:cysteinyl-tRNA synthetase [Chloroflexota bacterium]
MGLQVYSTLSRKKEAFETIEANKVRMYVCGPTVYDKAHVGHAMSALVFDIIRRYLEYRGYEVNHVMNYTDVDDKIINRANKMDVDPFELAETYIQQYAQHLKDLNILPATLNPRATREMDEIISFISDLIDKGYAYEAGGDVYYRVAKKDDYGKLSGRKLDDMRAGARIEVDERKENPLDFALWKAAKEGEPAWDSPWGKGRPGWHIECSAMSGAHLGEQIDIHGGGNDLIFPHHENEIAQSEAHTGKQFARYWIHNGMLQLSGEKMSKSIGNLITIEDFLAAHPADALRMMVLNSGYRNPLTFNDEVIGQAERGLERLQSGLKAAQPQAAGLKDTAALDEAAKAARSGFEASMDDDFNSAGALGHLFEFVRVINQARADGATDEQLKAAQDVLEELTGVLGLTLRADKESQAADAFVDLLVDVRQDVRQAKLWELSDKIRDQLAELGVQVEDAKGGSTWYWK